MKKYIMLGAFVYLYSTVSAQKTYEIQGQIDQPAQAAKLFLVHKVNNKTVMDSALSKNGRFAFNGNIIEPAKATLVLYLLTENKNNVRPSPGNQREFFIEPGNTKIKGNNLETATIKGGEVQVEYAAFEAMLQPKLQAVASFETQLRNADAEKRNEILPLLSAARAVIAETKNKYITTHGDSYVSLSLLQERTLGAIHLESFEPLYNCLSERMLQTAPGRKMTADLALARKLATGQPALDFTQHTTYDVPFTLSSLRGKYVLIDFWASWCGPCRAENPYLVKAYQAYHEKGLEIVGISLDDKKEPWLEAIKKDGLTWIHVSDLKGWENEVATNYGIRMVPQNYLLDKNGVIIAKNIRGIELENKLKGLMEL